MRPTIVWFRRDLRLSDNHALHAAAAVGPVVPLFVLDPAFAVAGAARRAFLGDALRSLSSATGGALLLRSGDPVDVVPAIVHEVGATAVHVTADFGPYGAQRDLAVARALDGLGVGFERHGTPYAVAPGTVRKADGTPYAVFTPFSKAWNPYADEPPLGTPGDVDWFRPNAPGSALPAAVDTGGALLPEATESAALAAADSFIGGALAGYDEHRNHPAIPGTSRLSPYLRWGLLHPRQLLARLDGSRAHSVFRSELCWREFYADVLHHRPQSARENLNRRMDAMPVDRDAAAVERCRRWCVGDTGYPIVDAGMRELAATGWMHNRVRMITASFLLKDLHLPWQWGARWFMRQLVDGDLASNSHGWQWTAGTGTDAAPYFRVFNPVAQGERFDPDGAYVRRWLPELDAVPDRYVQAPWTSPRGLPLGATPPMVDHAAERDESLRRYAFVTGR